MKFSLGVFLKRVPRERDPAPAIHSFDVQLATDDPEPEQVLERRKRYILEPYYWMIEYRDAKGVITRRRITMRTIEESGEYAYLVAFCHERNAIRSFRLDRVICLIDQDGAIEEPVAWFTEIMAISDFEETDKPYGFAKRGNGKPTQTISTYTAVRRALTPALELLVAAARSDDALHPGEIDAILAYAEDAACAMRDAGALPGAIDADIFDKLERAVRRLRPTREDILYDLTVLQGWEAEPLRRLTHALAKCIKADGQVDEIEAGILADLQSAGAITHGLGWQDG